MEQVVLIVHLILALFLIVVVLLQRSEGGALGMGGGGGGGGMVSSRGTATALTKATWAIAIAFIATSLTLTVLAAQNRGASAVIEAGDEPLAPIPDGLQFNPQLPDLGAPASDGPATPPPAE